MPRNKRTRREIEISIASDEEAQRLLQHYVWKNIKTTKSGCWEWQPTRDPDGYGRTSVEGVQMGTHRISYTVFVGLIPDGLHIDHLCKNKACQNPIHLEPVTPMENVLRGDGPWRKQLETTHCPRGHEYTADNTIRKAPNKKRRFCKTCEYARNRAASKRRTERKRPPQ